MKELSEELTQPKVKLLCFDVTKYTQLQQFWICSTLVLGFYIVYGYLQEMIFSTPSISEHALFLTWIQFGCYSIFGITEQTLQRQRERRVPWSVYQMLAALTVTTMVCSNAALRYLNYPTQVIFKGCKMIPVMIGSVVIQKKTYQPHEYLATLLMSTGLVFFILADSRISPVFDITGVILILIALLADAGIGNIQEKTLKTYGAGITEVVLYSYFCGLFYILLALIFLGQLWGSISFCQENPSTYVYTVVFSLMGYLGIQAVLLLVRTCGALVAVSVTTFRKAFSIILSFLLFSKPFTFQYVWSGSLVLIGVLIATSKKEETKSIPTVFHPTKSETV